MSVATDIAHTAPRRYLPPVEMLGTFETWDFTYEMAYPSTSPASAVVSIPVTGTYQDMGSETIEVGGVTYEDAWHIRSDYTMELTAIGVFTRG